MPTFLPAPSTFLHWTREERTEDDQLHLMQQWPFHVTTKKNQVVNCFLHWRTHQSPPAVSDVGCSGYKTVCFIDLSPSLCIWAQLHCARFRSANACAGAERGWRKTPHRAMWQRELPRDSHANLRLQWTERTSDFVSNAPDWCSFFFFFFSLHIIKGVDRGNVLDVICSRFKEAYLCLMKSYEKSGIQIGLEMRAVK